MPRKKLIVVDSSNNEVRCYTVREAVKEPCKEIGLTKQYMKGGK